MYARSSTIRGNPQCWMAWNNLAGLLVSRGAADEAAGPARRALDLRPDYPEAHNNLALALARSGQGGEAIEVGLGEGPREGLDLADGVGAAHGTGVSKSTYFTSTIAWGFQTSF